MINKSLKLTAITSLCLTASCGPLISVKVDNKESTRIKGIEAVVNLLKDDEKFLFKKPIYFETELQEDHPVLIKFYNLFSEILVKQYPPTENKEKVRAVISFLDPSIDSAQVHRTKELLEETIPGFIYDTLIKNEIFGHKGSLIKIDYYNASYEFLVTEIYCIYPVQGDSPNFGKQIDSITDFIGRVFIINSAREVSQ